MSRRKTSVSPEEYSSLRALTFPDTPPDGWLLLNLGDLLVDMRYGTSSRANKLDEGYPVLRIPNVIGNRIDTSDVTHLEVTEDDKQRYRLSADDILVVRTNANPDYLGRCALFRGIDGDWLFASYLIRLRVDTKRVLPDYLVRWLQSRFIRQKIRALGHTSAGNYNLNTDDLRSLPVLLPPLGEQMRVTSILQVCDSFIQNVTEAIRIDTQFKNALLQRLLTRGIGQTSFKKTEIGEIPETWGLAQLADARVSSKIRAGGTPRRSTRAFFEGGNTSFVKIEDITRAGKYLTRTEDRISNLGLENSSAWIVPSGSILFSMYASYGEVTINKIPVATSQAILAIVPSKQIDSEFLYYALSSMKPKLVQHLRQTTQKNLNGQIVKSLWIPLPSYDEQCAISSVLALVDSVLRKEVDTGNASTRLKSGLMQALLTGKVRVKV